MEQCETELSGAALVTLSRTEFEDLLSNVFRSEFQILRSEFKALAASVWKALKDDSALRAVASAPSEFHSRVGKDAEVASRSENHAWFANDGEMFDESRPFPGVPESCAPRSSDVPQISKTKTKDQDLDDLAVKSRCPANPRASDTITSSKRMIAESMMSGRDSSYVPTPTGPFGSRGTTRTTMSTSSTPSAGSAISNMRSLARPVFSQQKKTVRETLRMSTYSEHEAIGGPMSIPMMIVKSNWFYYLMCAFIVLNSIAIGAEVDFRIRNPTQDTPDVFIVFEIAFCVVFSTELLLRILAQHKHFFASAGRAYNLFDTVLVCAQIVDIVFYLFVRLNTSASIIRSARLIRVFRLVRVVRVLRLVHVVDELRKLVYLIVASFGSFIWTLVLFVILTYIFAILFTQLVADSAERILSEVGPDSRLFHYFGSLADSMNSLFQAVTGGAEWEVMSTELMKHISVWLGLVFAFYVAFGTLVLLNLVTGVFVEGAMRLTKQDREEELLRKVRRLFRRNDTARGRSTIVGGVLSGTISRDDFLAQVDTEQMQEIFHLMDIDSKIAGHLFEILDVNHDGTLSAEEFVSGALNLKGPARALQVQGLFQVQLDLFQEMLESLAMLRLDVVRGVPADATSDSETRRFVTAVQSVS